MLQRAPFQWRRRLRRQWTLWAQGGLARFLACLSGRRRALRLDTCRPRLRAPSAAMSTQHLSDHRALGGQARCFLVERLRVWWWLTARIRRLRLGHKWRASRALRLSSREARACAVLLCLRAPPRRSCLRASAWRVLRFLGLRPQVSPRVLPRVRPRLRPRSPPLVSRAPRPRT